MEHDFEEMGYRVKSPATLFRWMAAYAAATSTTASFETVRNAATGDQGQKPAKTTTQPYRDLLERLWIIDAIQAWAPTNNQIARLSFPPKHHLADPALAARLLGVTFETLQQKGPLFGQLFESLVALSLRTYAQACEARVGHFRTGSGRHEIDLIVERPDGRIVAFEVKLGSVVQDGDVYHLKWLKEKIGSDLLDAVVITTGNQAYRRQDGVAVVPAVLLGP